MKLLPCWVGCVALAVSAVPVRAADLVLLCYLRQTGGGRAVDFVRRIDIDRAARRVTIADDLGQGFHGLAGQVLLVRADRGGVVFDYASAYTVGRTSIDSRTGRYSFSDAQVSIRGTCSPFRG